MRGHRWGNSRRSNSGRIRFEILEPRHLLSASSQYLPDYIPPVSIVSGPSAETLAAASAQPNQAITTNADVQQMPSVAVDPNDSRHIAIAYMDYSLVDTGYAGIGVAVSRDGGGTWQYSSVALPASFEQGAANPSLKFDGQGHVFVSFMAQTYLGEKAPITNPTGTNPATRKAFSTFGFTSTNGVFVARSDDGGETWNAPAVVSKFTYDGTTPVPYDRMPDMAIDTNPNSGNYGDIYVVWSRYYPKGQFPGEPTSTGGSTLEISVSSDGGATFQARPHIPDSFDSGIGPPEGLAAALWVHPMVGPQGNVYVSFYDLGNFIVLHSENAGLSFDPYSTDSVENLEHTVFGNGGAAADSIAGGALTRLRGFRTNATRSFVADPTRPGTLYAFEFMPVTDVVGNEIDSDVYFARSDDNGLHWTTLQLNGVDLPINDDNSRARYTGAESEVGARQFLTSLGIDEHGNIVAVWYDTRRDPGNENLDVFAAISTDGGQSFGPNFRLTDQSFDVEAGKFTDAVGRDNYYLGDFIGLSIDGDTAYVSWADTSAGNQDIVLAHFSISDPPLPENDRYEPNNDVAGATDLGQVIRRIVPKLSIAPGDVDLFKLRTPATGTLVVTATQALSGQHLAMDLVDESGNAVLAVGQPVRDSAGTIIGQRVTVPSNTGQDFTLRVRSASGTATEYALDIQGLTANLGTIAHRVLSGQLNTQDQNYFLFGAAAAGSAQVVLTPGAGAQGLVLEILDARTLDVLASGTASNMATLTVSKHQMLLARVVGADALAGGPFSLMFTNIDSFATADRTGLTFPAGNGPSQLASGDLNHDGRADIVVTNGLSNTVSVLLGNGDGSFQAPRQFGVGAFYVQLVGGPFIVTFRRDLVLNDFDRDGNLDIAVTNLSSSDLSVLLGRGDGTFEPQRRFDATSQPFGIASGDLNHDGILDLAAIDVAFGEIHLAVLLGRGDGTFRNQILIPTGITGSGPSGISSEVKIADVDNDGNADLIYTGALDGKSYVRLGTGDGVTFGPATQSDGSGPGIVVIDLDRDGNLDIVNTTLASNTISYAFGNGDGTFGKSTEFFGGTSPVDVQVADLASLNPDGSLGLPDGILDIISVGTGYPQGAFQGPPEIMISPGFFDGGELTYGDAVNIANASQPLGVIVLNVDGDSKSELAYIDTDGVRLIFNAQHSIPPNNTRGTARDLGTLVHLVQPTLTITPGHDDSWFRLRVPTEVVAGAGDQVLDFSGGFANQDGGGLLMEVVDAAGNIRGSGERFRVVAKQDEELFVHILGKPAAGGPRGTGAYTLVINTLPQVAGIEAHNLLPGQGNQPGGPTTSLVIAFQGERLDPATAEDPTNYVVTWLGTDGVFGTNDDRQFPIGANLPVGTKSAVYDPGGNVDVSSGRTFPTAIRQTVTLLFGDPLPAGSYRIEVKPNVVSTAFNSEEASLLSPAGGLTGHPVVAADVTGVHEGSQKTNSNLVLPPSSLGNFQVFVNGTRFLTQLHNDLGALLDAGNTELTDLPTITDDILAQIIDRMSPALGPAGQRIASMAVFFLDPVSIGLVDPDGHSLTYDLQTSLVSNNLPQTFVEVGGNVEVIVIPNPSGVYRLNVADVPGRARGGMVYFSNLTSLINSFTDALRSGVISFSLDFGSRSAPASDSGTRGVPASDSGTRVVPAFLATASASFASVSRTTFGINSPTSVANSSSILTLLTLLSGTSTDSGAGADADSGDGRSQSGSSPDALQSAWESLSNLLIGLDEKSEEPGSDKSKSGSPLFRAWHVIGDILGDIFGPGEGEAPLGPNAIRHETAKQDSQQPNAESSKDRSTTPADKRETGESTTGNNSNADQNTSDAGRPTDPAAQSTEASSPQPNLPAASKDADGNDSYATSA